MVLILPFKEWAWKTWLKSLNHFLPILGYVSFWKVGSSLYKDDVMGLLEFSVCYPEAERAPA